MVILIYVKANVVHWLRPPPRNQNLSLRARLKAYPRKQVGFGPSSLTTSCRIHGTVPCCCLVWHGLGPFCSKDQWYDKGGVWTDSATIRSDGRIIMLYAGYTMDSILFHPQAPKKDFRDPTTTWLTSLGKWRITIGSKMNKTGISLGLDTSINGPGVKHVVKVSLDDDRRDYYAIDMIMEYSMLPRLYTIRRKTEEFYGVGLEKRIVKLWIWKDGISSVEETDSLRLNSTEFEKVSVHAGSVVPLDVGPAPQLDIIAEFEVDKEALKTANGVHESFSCKTSGGGAAKRGALGSFGASRREPQRTNFSVYHSIIESFSQGGRTVITSRVYPTEAVYGAAKVFLFNNGTDTNVTASLKIWQMNSAFIQPYPVDDDDNDDHHKSYAPSSRFFLCPINCFVSCLAPNLSWSWGQWRDFNSIHQGFPYSDGRPSAIEDRSEMNLQDHTTSFHPRKLRVYIRKRAGGALAKEKGGVQSSLSSSSSPLPTLLSSFIFASVLASSF
ncbi:hypothetical protein F3Y22_tig00110057pilonHSYRG00269 [Hibiscus syriacus]|uniref:Glycosyl hydrolase family 32 C-terminal domain-containing protein n=1 Tax=Hibiscus syriacus TaxID=106335 RepID=A0A6A3BKW7_HIBSY|nr:hypothetical protein F3Y22_tig00110057pilonHSYRG00269 [Hibiscus syriacus]